MSTDFFADAIAVQKEQKKKAEESKGGGNYSFDWIEVEYLGMELDILKAFRIWGVPAEKRRNKHDPKIVLMSQILKDDGKSFQKVIWPINKNVLEEKGKYQPDPNWIFTRLMDTVQKSNWVDYVKEDVGKKDERGDEVVESLDGKLVNDRTDRTGRYVSVHHDKECYKLFRDNFLISQKGNKISNNTYPSCRVTMNILDRMDDWCKKNKKYKVLTNNLNISTFKGDDGTEQTRAYADTGISKTAYDKILNHFMRYRQDWYVDVAVCKTKANNIYDWEILESSSIKLPDHLKEIMSDSPLTDEEEDYELNDLDAINKVTSALSLKKNHEAKFRSADLELGTNFLQELDVLCKKEKEEYAKQMKEKEEVKSETPTPVVEDVPEEPVVETPAPTPDPVETVEAPKEEVPVETTRKPRGVAKEEVGIDFSVLPNYDKLDNDDKTDLVSFTESIVDGKLVFKDGSDLYNCDSCKEPLPNTLLNCPYCGTHFNI